jgi:uncharacterized membrane protein YkoI
MNRRLAVLLTASLLVSPQLTGPARADGHREPDQEAALQALQHHQVLPLSQVLALAARRVPGDVIKVKLEREDGHIVYEIKVLARTGRIREITFDAGTGAVLKIEGD